MDTELKPKVFGSSRRLSSFQDLKIPGPLPNSPAPHLNKTTSRRSSKNSMAISFQVQDEVIHQHFQLCPKDKTEADIKLIRESLRKHFVFNSLIDDDGITNYLLESFFYCTIEEGEFIMRQGDNASSFFVLEEGSLSVIVGGIERRTIVEGEGFGELALLYNTPRSASLQAVRRCTLWGISRVTFRKVIETICSKQFSEYQKSVENLKFFRYLTAAQKASIASQLITQQYEDGDRIVNEGDPASSLYILKFGRVAMRKGGIAVDEDIKVGQSFGEESLKSEEQVRPCSIHADGKVSLLALSRDSVNKLFGSNFQQIVVRNKISNYLQNSPIYSQLSELNREKLIDTLIIEKVSGQQPLVTPGLKVSNKMFFVIEGLGEKGVIKTFHGESAVLSPSDTYSEEVTLPATGLIAVTSLCSIEQALEGSWEIILAKQKQVDSITQSQRQAVELWKEQTLALNLSELKIVKKMGQGQFGQVYLVTIDNRSSYYALKCISKSQILELRLEKHLKQEKEALEMLNHPFLIQYGRSFKDQHFIYFLTEFINGTELFDVIRDMGLLNTLNAQFYAGSLLLMLEYLHSHGIIYRDLKPQNIMVNQDGYLKMIDMGTCCLMDKASISKTFTILGTPHYMAPEVITGKGYTYNADLWSLGVCLYQFVCGYVPFGEEADDPYEIYQQIINKDIKYPNYVVDEATKHFVFLMLNKTPEIRLSGSFAALKAHPWFCGLDWDELIAKRLPPPYKISESKLVDLSQLGGERLRQLSEELKVSKGKSLKRKVLDPNWDMIF